MTELGAIDLTETWRGAEWRAEVESWIRDRIAESGLTATGPIEQPRVRPWSTQLIVPTDRGQYWFKENCPALRFEAGLVARIAKIAPDRVIVPLAVEEDRGWLLSPDGGSTVRELGADEAMFTRIMIEYAELQRVLVDHRDALIATGLQVLEPADTADHLDRQLAWLSALPTEHPSHADAGMLERAARYRPVIIEATDRLAALGLPSTLKHNDLHQNNVFAPTSGTSGGLFFDFNDAVWSHPFCSLRIALDKLGQEWSCGIDDPRIVRIVDAYLDGWTDLAPLAELRHLVEPAMMIGGLHRYNSWHRLVPHLPMDMIKSHAGYLNSLLRISSDGAG